jgi:hemolysin III
LVRVAADHSSRVAAIVFSLALWALYGVSATYHRFTWRPRARANMRRADHSMIFVLIAGTYTAVALLVLSPGWQRALLALVWTGAAVGIALKVFVHEASRKVTGAMYIVLGWAAVLVFPQFVAGSACHYAAIRMLLTSQG